MPRTATKRSYTITCPSRFRDEAIALAARRKANVGDLARSIVLVVPAEVVVRFLDPGEPGRGDREAVVLKSGVAKGRLWRRKPRLQMRLAPGFSVSFIRRALALALALDRGELGVRVGAASAADEQTLRDEIERLRAIVAILSFEPLPQGVQSREDALYVLGFPPGRLPDQAAVRNRFRELAAVHHPDSETGSHERMAQLNAAVELLRRGV